MQNALRQLLCVMRITAFILLVFALHLSARTVSQTITFSGTNVSVKIVFAAIEQQTGWTLTYDASLVEQAHPVTLHVLNMHLAEFLEKLSAQQPFDYVLSHRTIFLVSRNQPKQSASPSTFFPVARLPVKGLVIDEEGNPIPEVSIIIKGKIIGTKTGTDGNFLINVTPGDVLLISSVGYVSKEINIYSNDSQTAGMLRITLTRLNSKLDEVQIIAYGTTTPRFNTGNVSKVSSKDIENQPVSDLLSAIEGRVPGVFISQGNGLPGAALTVQIRGKNSLRYEGNAPLYIIDGVPFTSTSLDDPYQSSVGIQTSPLSSINPSDIESLEVLKDADATAIYGSRGANGVILITTKAGKTGKTKVDASFSTGWEKAPHKLKFLNTPQYLQMRREAFAQDGVNPDISNAPDLLLWDTTRYTDWQDVLIGGTARRTNANASMSGGDNHTQYLISADFLKETTVLPGDFYNKKGSFHVSLNNTSDNSRFNSHLLLNYIKDVRYLPMSDPTRATYIAPDAPSVYDSSGKLNWASSTWDNPFSQFLQVTTSKTDNLIANLSLSYQLLPGLQLKTSMGYNNLAVNQTGITPLASYNPAYGVTSGYASYSDNELSSWVIEPLLDYKRKLHTITLQLQLGGTFQKNTKIGKSVLGLGFADDKLLYNEQNASSLYVQHSGTTDYNYEGVFSRINVNWKEKYLLNLTARRDGSSRFGTGRRFGNFGAIGAGWIFSEERWLKDHLPFLSFGKLRVSYGTAGNDQIDDYGYLDAYQPTGLVYGGVAVITPQNLANPDYSWETIRKAEAGLELGFSKDRLLIGLSYYHNRSSNQLVGYSLPAITGFESVQANLPAIVQNTGWELEINTVNIRQKQFSWSTSLNFSAPRNKLIAYPDLENSSYANSYIVGQSLFIFKRFKFLTLDPATGIYTFRDYNRDENISYPEDYQYSKFFGTSWYGGISNTFAYEGFQLDVLIQFVKQTVFSYIDSYPAPGVIYSSGSGNQPTAVLDRWKTAGDQTQVQRYTQDYSSAAGLAYSNLVSSDQAITDGSFVRLKNVAVSYTIPQKLFKSLHLAQAKFYIQGQNLAILKNKKYVGLDPETGDGMPPLRSIVAGIQISL